MSRLPSPIRAAVLALVRIAVPTDPPSHLSGTDDPLPPEVEVDPSAALTFCKRADWAGYRGWVEARLAHPERPIGE